ncbi:hypothetical protein FGG08_004830 [Glutinoglossum americanum]|uniref:Uncharacterized protein n=1 Tax=Glutinoglossum americanum TaxID=1670608 RepID=A0A9P8I4U7_9PEZI|nr:hypothetical protein FGG08_004830 [Glutinoglossum americanum]
MTWGYDAQVMNFFDRAGQSSIAGHSQQLLADLSRKRMKPEEALFQSFVESKAEKIYKPRIAKIKSQTIGVAFAGTPHRGSEKAKWAHFATSFATVILKDHNDKLVDALKTGSEVLERLQLDFARLMSSLKIYSFFEDYQYPKIGKIVDNWSASLGYPQEHIGSIPGNHSNMVKFSERDDIGYERMMGAISELIADGLEDTAKKENRSARHIGIAVKAHSNNHPAFLNFEEGAVIDIIKIAGKLWTGKLNGKTGIFVGGIEEINVGDSANVARGQPYDCVDVQQLESAKPTMNRHSWKPTPEIRQPISRAPTFDLPIREEQLSEIPVDLNARRPQVTSASTSSSAASAASPEGFLIAAEEGYIESVRRQLSKGVDVNAQGGSFGTALVAAASNGHTDIVRLLLNSGADVNAPGGKDGFALHAAAYKGHVSIIKILLSRGAAIQIQGGQYRFALTSAAVAGSIRVMKLLLENDAQLNAQDRENETALHGAVYGGGGNVEAVKFLLERGIDRDVRGHQGTALEMARAMNPAEFGNMNEIIQLLSDSPVEEVYSENASAVAGTSQPPLSINTETESEVNEELLAYLRKILVLQLWAAAAENNIEDVKTLLDPPEPVDVNQTFDDESGCALHAAAQNDHLNVVALLLDRGADVNAQGGPLGNALQAAAWNGNLLMVTLLIAYGANVNAGGGLFGAALQAAASNGHIDCMAMLIRMGAQIDLAGGKFHTVLHAAASSGLAPTRFLISVGANPKWENKEGLSARDIAHAFQHKDVELLLKEHGVKRAPFFSLRRLVCWSVGFQLKIEQQQKDAAMQQLLQQYAQAAVQSMTAMNDNATEAPTGN